MTLVNNTQGGAPMNIFVFGSNLAGRHGRGAALAAVKHHGAKYGQGVGLQGNAYAIPTKDENLRVLPLDKIQPYIEEFLEFAAAHPEMKFYVTKIGCGLAGYTPAQIRPMFWVATTKINVSANVNLPIEFGGTRDVSMSYEQWLDEQERLGDASTQSSTTELSYIHTGVKLKDSTTTKGVMDANVDLQEREGACCKICGACQPDRTDGYCQNDYHKSKWGKHLESLEINPALIYTLNDTVYYNEDDELIAHRYQNEKGFTIAGRINPSPSTKKEIAFRKSYKPTAAEIAVAENAHLHKTNCPCVACSIGGIVYLDDNNEPTGATRSDPMGMGNSFELPTGNKFQQPTKNVQEEFLLWHKTGGMQGIDPEMGDWMMRIDARKKIVNANFEYDKVIEVSITTHEYRTVDNIRVPDEGKSVMTREVKLKNFARGESHIHKMYGPRGTKEELESANPELMGLQKDSCDCMKEKNYKGCDCVLKINTASWNKSRIKTSDGHQSICMGDYYKAWQWFENPWIGFPAIDWKPLRTAKPVKTEMTPWQKDKITEFGIAIPEGLSYDDAYKIVSNLFVTPPKVEESKEIVKTIVDKHNHLMSHKSGDSFNVCEECGIIFTHIDKSVDSETGKETSDHDELHLITGIDEMSEPELKQMTVSHVQNTEPYYWACHVYPMMDIPQQVVEVQVERHVIERISTKKHLEFNPSGNLSHPVRIGIVGASHIPDWKKAEMTSFVRSQIANWQAEFGEQLVIVSGGANGIDGIAEDIAIELGVKTDIKLPDHQDWYDGKWDRELGRIEVGYRTRNLRIAKSVCRLVNIVGAANKESVVCKHCHKQHYSSGGCWTAKQAFMAGADVQTKEI